MPGVTTSDGRHVEYLVRGPADGRTVVYLHGMPSCRLEACLLPDALLHGFGVRLVAPDRAGWGRTDPLAGDRVARTADVLAVCDALGVKTFPLLASSSGGSYALALAASAPERVERVVLSGGQMPYDDEAAIASLQPDQLRLVAVLRRGRSDKLVAGLEQYREGLLSDAIATLAGGLATLSPREREWLAQPTERALFADAIAEGVRAGIHGLLDDLLLWPKPFEVDLARVRCPVRAVHGTADDWEPLSNLKRIADQLHDAQLVLLDGLNHFGPLILPELELALSTSG